MVNIWNVIDVLVKCTLAIFFSVCLPNLVYFVSFLQSLTCKLVKETLSYSTKTVYKKMVFKNNLSVYMYRIFGNCKDI